MACSVKTLASLAALLLMALAAAAAPAGRRGGSLLEAEERCSESRDCKADTCGATCAVLGFDGVGVCKVDGGGVPSCCCVPKPKPSASVGVYQLAH
ncbi:hypothetical protein GQ55_8G067300 [Panicum hallii var. hallii]|uniref:Knottin scorpion toxin-like domain-containing protein n=1 Tax=Panicum hallii var. hallii TaxID=1504633 RepID=A0A2T7CLG3_9POAL|nr:hypothetical protein GQ55_8G067300 [Panicum hallii var. hallii]